MLDSSRGTGSTPHGMTGFVRPPKGSNTPKPVFLPHSTGRPVKIDLPDQPKVLW